MHRFITLSYWLDRFPDVDYRYSKITLGIALLMIVIGIAIEIYRKKSKNEALRKSLRRVPKPFISHGIVLGLLLFFRKNFVPFLSMRIWFLVLALSFIYKTIRNGLRARADYARRKKV